MGYLIDTCLWIDVERGALSPADIGSVTGKEPIFISPVTIAELKYGAEIAADFGVRQKRVAALQRLRYRVQDLWLASQAIQFGFKFLTHNEDDFEDIPGLDLVVWSKVVGR